MASMESLNMVQQFYIAYYGRPADPAGLAFWADQFEQSDDLNDVLSAFGTSDEFTTNFGSLTNDELINNLYQQMFGRDAGEEGLDFYTGRLDSGEATLASIAKQIADGATGDDAIVLANKIIVGQTYTATVTSLNSTYESDDIADAKAILGAVDATDASVTAGNAAAQAEVASNDPFTYDNVAYHTLTAIEDTPGEQVLMWGYTPNDERVGGGQNEADASQGIPVEDLLDFLGNITNIDLFELGLIDDDGVANDVNDVISNITIGDLTADDQSPVTITTNDGQVITGEASLGEDYMNFLSDLIVDGDGNSRLYVMSEDDEAHTIVLTPSENNGGTFEGHFTTSANDIIVAGRTELLHGAYIDGGEGYDILEVDMKGIYAQPLQLLNIEQVNVQNLPNVYGDTRPDEYTTNGSDLNSILDLSRATSLQKLIVTEGLNTGEDLGSLTIVGIHNGADLALEGGFSEDVNLHYGQGLGDAVNLELNIGDAGEEFTLNIAHNSNTLNIDSQMGENAIDNVSFGDGVLSNLNITGDAALYIGSDLSDSFHDGRTATIDASENTGGVDLLLSGQPDVFFVGSMGDDDFTATGSENVTIVDSEGDNTLNTDGSETVNITSGSGYDEISSIGSVEVTIGAGDGDNTVIASAADITVATGVDDDSITIAGTEGGTEGSVTTGVTAVNLMFVLDNSGSLSTQQLADEKAAANALLDDYVAKGLDTAVRLVMFSPADSTYNDSNEAWLSVSDAKTVIAAMDASGGTNFDEALAVSIDAWNGDPTGTQPTDMTLFNTSNAANQVVFMSDGLSSSTAQTQTDWETFLSNNGIISYAFGFGAADTVSIDPVAYDGVNSQQIPSVIVTDSQDLIDTIVLQAGGQISGISGSQAIINIDTGAGQNALMLGDDDELSQGLTALTGSVITGENISLIVEATSDITQAAVTGVTSVMLEGDTNLRLTAEQFIAIGAGNFAVENSAFGADATLTIVTDESMHFDDLGITTETFDCNNINLYIELACNSAKEVTFTLTAEQLHEYIAVDGINVDSNNDYDNDQVVVTDASLDFDAFGQSTDDNDDVIASGGGTIANGIGEQDVTVLRSLDGYSRPSEDDLVDMMTINSDETLDAVPGFGDAGTLLKTLVIEGDADIAFEGAINLADSFTVDFSALTGAIDGLTLAEFEDIYVDNTDNDLNDGTWGEIIGNGGSRVNIQVTNDASVGYNDIQQGGIHSSGVSTFVVTDINDPDNKGEVLSQNVPGQTAAIFVCDSTQGVETLGLQNNRNAAVTFENVNWGTTILLEGDGYADSSDQEKNLGNPDLSQIGSVEANYFESGANVVVNINNQGVDLGMSEDAEDGYDLDGERVLDVAGITVNNADRLTINVEDGDAVINDLTAVDVERLFVTGPEDVAITVAEGGLDTDDLMSIDASGVVDVFTLNLTGDYDFSEVVLTGIDALVLNDDVDLTLNAEQVVELGAVIVDAGDGGDTTLSIVEFATQALNLPAIDVDDLGSVTFADVDGTILVDPGTVFGNAVNSVDSLTILVETSDTTVEMTAAQFNQVAGADPAVDDGMPGVNPTTGAAFVATLVLTDLAADTVIDLNSVKAGIVNIVRVDGIVATDDMEIINGTATLEVSGTTDLTDAAIPAVDAVDLEAGAELTLTAAQVAAIGFDDANGDGIADNWSGLAGATLNVTDLEDESIDLDLIAAAGITIGTVSIENTDTAELINPATTFGGGEVVTPTKDADESSEATSVTMTIEQFLTTSGVISGDAEVHLTDLVNNVDSDADFDLDSADYVLTGIANPGTITLGDPTVRLTETADLSSFEILLSNGQMIQFATDGQASGTTVTEISGVTAIAWLFDSIALPQIDTLNYDADINTLYVNEVLVDGANEEELWNTLPGTIVVEKVNTADIPNVLIGFERTNTIEALSSIPAGLTFNDLAEYQTTVKLTINLEGNVEVGNMVIDDTVGAGTFEELIINSYEDRSTLDDDNGFVMQPNKLGDISLSATPSNELVNITLNTYADANGTLEVGDVAGLPTSDGGFFDTANVNGMADAERDGLALEVGTITFGSEGDNYKAILTLNGSNDITIADVDISDTDITLLYIDNNTTPGTDVEIGGVEYDQANIWIVDNFVDDPDTADYFGIIGAVNHLVVSNGDNDLTTVAPGDFDIDSVHFSGDATLTLTAAQVLAIGIVDADMDGVADNWSTDGGTIKLHITDLGTELLDLNAIQDAGIDIGDITVIDAGAELAAGTTLGGADSVTLIVDASDTTLELTAVQYQKIDGLINEVLSADAVDSDFRGIVIVDELEGIENATTGLVNIDLSTVNTTGANTVAISEFQNGSFVAGGDGDVMLNAAAILGSFSFTLYDVNSTIGVDYEVTAGETIRFATAVQAERDVIILGADNDAANDPGLAFASEKLEKDTNVVWLFDTITGTVTAGVVDTSGYDANLGRLWMLDDLVDGENVDALFTTLAEQIIIRIDEGDLTGLLQLTQPIDQNVEVSAFTDLDNGLEFTDDELLEHIFNLEITLGGETDIGDLSLDNILAPVDPLFPNFPGDDEFGTLTINSYVANTNTHYLLPDDWDIAINPLPNDPAYGFDGTNVIGDISSGPLRGELANVTINTGDGAGLDEGADLEVQTIYLTDDDALSTASVDVNGVHDVTIKSLDTTDVEITVLTIDLVDHTGVFTVTGGSPAAAVGNTETINVATAVDSEAWFGYVWDATANGGAGAYVLNLDDASVPYAGVAGADLSLIDVTGNGDVNLGVIALIDGTDDDTDGDGTPDQAAFTLNGNDITTAILGAGNVNGVVTAPELEALSTWAFNDVALTITEDVVFQAGGILDLFDVDLTIEGVVDLTEVDLIINHGLINGDTTISVPDGNTLILTVAQLGQVDMVDIMGEGTLQVMGDASNITLGAHILVANVNFSAVTIDTDADSILDVNLNNGGATDDDGTADELGFTVTGSVNDDNINASNHDDDLTGGLGDDTLTGLDGADIFNVDAGTDTISDLGLATTGEDVLVVAAGATVAATLAAGSDFVATAATTNDGTAGITVVDGQDNTIDVSLAGGANGFSLTGSTLAATDADILTGSDQDDTINGGNAQQTAAVAIDTLTGNLGNDTFVFNLTTTSPATLTDTITTIGEDHEEITMTADGVDWNDEFLTITYKVNAQINAVVVDLSGIDVTVANDVATAVAASLDGITGFSAAVDGVTLNQVNILGDNGNLADIISVVPGGTTTTLAGAIANGVDVVQINDLTMTGPTSAGETYNLTVTLKDGLEIVADEYVATGAETDPQLATAIVNNFNTVAALVPGGAPVVAAVVGVLGEFTLTDQDGDDGGFDVTNFAGSGSFGGSGASDDPNVATLADANADIITDFTSGNDLVALQDMPDGGPANYNEGPDVIDYATALFDANTAMDGTVLYYLTSTAADAGLLFFDANADGTVDGVINLLGVNSASFDDTDIVALP